MSSPVLLACGFGSCTFTASSQDELAAHDYLTRCPAPGGDDLEIIAARIQALCGQLEDGHTPAPDDPSVCSQCGASLVPVGAPPSVPPVFYARQLPNRLVVDLEGAQFLVPLHPGGWRERSRFVGFRVGLVRVSDAEARVQLLTTGWEPKDGGASHG